MRAKGYSKIPLRLDRLGCHLDVLKVEKIAREGDGLAGKSAADDFERLVGARAALLGGHAEARKFFAFKADPDTELETAAQDDINGRNILGKSDRIVKRHQQHARCDADPVGAGGDRRCGGKSESGYQPWAAVR